MSVALDPTVRKIGPIDRHDYRTAFTNQKDDTNYDITYDTDEDDGEDDDVVPAYAGRQMRGPEDDYVPPGMVRVRDSHTGRIYDMPPNHVDLQRNAQLKIVAKENEFYCLVDPRYPHRQCTPNPTYEETEPQINSAGTGWEARIGDPVPIYTAPADGPTSTGDRLQPVRPDQPPRRNQPPRQDPPARRGPREASASRPGHAVSANVQAPSNRPRTTAAQSTPRMPPQTTSSNKPAPKKPREPYSKDIFDKAAGRIRPHSASPQATLPQPAVTTAVPQQAVTTAVPQQAVTTAVPQPAVTTAVPQQAVTTAVPQPAVTTAVPQPAVTTAVPQRSTSPSKYLATCDSFFSCVRPQQGSSTPGEPTGSSPVPNAASLQPAQEARPGPAASDAPPHDIESTKASEPAPEATPGPVVSEAPPHEIESTSAPEPAASTSSSQPAPEDHQSSGTSATSQSDSESELPVAPHLIPDGERPGATTSTVSRPPPDSPNDATEDEELSDQALSADLFEDRYEPMPFHMCEWPPFATNGTASTSSASTSSSPAPQIQIQAAITEGLRDAPTYIESAIGDMNDRTKLVVTQFNIAENIMTKGFSQLREEVHRLNSRMNVQARNFMSASENAISELKDRAQDLQCAEQSIEETRRGFAAIQNQHSEAEARLQTEVARLGAELTAARADAARLRETVANRDAEIAALRENASHLEARGSASREPPQTDAPPMEAESSAIRTEGDRPLAKVSDFEDDTCFISRMLRRRQTRTVSAMIQSESDRPERERLERIFVDARDQSVRSIKMEDSPDAQPSPAPKTEDSQGMQSVTMQGIGWKLNEEREARRNKRKISAITGEARASIVSPAPAPARTDEARMSTTSTAPAPAQTNYAPLLNGSQIVDLKGEIRNITEVLRFIPKGLWEAHIWNMVGVPLDVDPESVISVYLGPQYGPVDIARLGIDLNSWMDVRDVPDVAEEIVRKRTQDLIEACEKARRAAGDPFV